MFARATVLLPTRDYQMRVTKFTALSVDSRVGISRSASEIDDWLFFLPITD